MVSDIKKVLVLIVFIWILSPFTICYALIQDAKLLPDNIVLGQRFGYSVAINERIAVVGAPNDSTNGEKSGAVYVFGREEKKWKIHSKLVPQDGKKFDAFGYATAISGDNLIISSRPDSDILSKNFCNKIYLYQRINDKWIEKKIFTTSCKKGIEGWDAFGASVAISGNYAVVGAPRSYKKPLNITPGKPIQFRTPDGGAYVYELGENGWTFHTYLTPGKFGYEFGNSVSIDGDRIVVGSRKYGEKGKDTGAAYIYKKTARFGN